MINKKTMRKTVLLFILFIFTFAAVDAQETGSKKAVTLYGNDHYMINSKANLHTIYINKEPYESFSIKLQKSLFKNKTVLLKFTSDRPANVKICAFKNTEKIGTEIELHSLSVSKVEKQVSLDLNNSTFENEEEVLLIVYVEPGFKWNGQLLLKVENGIKTENLSTDLNISPNPAKDFVYVNCEGVKEGIYKIFDSNGKQIIEQTATFDKDNFKMDVSNFSSGTYLFVLYANNIAYKSKLIIANNKKL